MNTEERFWQKCHESTEVTQRERTLAHHYFRGNEEYTAITYRPSKAASGLGSLWLSGIDTLLEDAERSWDKGGGSKVLDGCQSRYWVTDDSELHESRPTKSHK